MNNMSTDLLILDQPQTLRKAGLRVTAPRLAVLGAVQGEGRHRDADEIAVSSRERLGTLSIQAVYDNLHVLVEAGLVRRIQPSGSHAGYANSGAIDEGVRHCARRRRWLAERAG